MTGKRVLLAKPRGYCAGVDRAVQTVEEALTLYGPPIYVRKEIVHNRHVVATRDHHIAPGGHFADNPDYVHSWPAHCVAGTEGVGFHPNFAPAIASGAVDAVFDKGAYAAAYSGFEGADENGVSLADWLRARDIDEVDVVGIATDHCVRATALDAADEGFQTTVLLDLTAGVAPETTAKTLDELAAAGVATSGSVVAPD